MKKRIKKRGIGEWKGGNAERGLFLNWEEPKKSRGAAQPENWWLSSEALSYCVMARHACGSVEDDHGSDPDR
jgi:hypothetical protein